MSTAASHGSSRFSRRSSGTRFDPTADVSRERRAIREAVERYRRKATIPAIRRTLAPLGWKGEIEETFRKALRLGQRSRLNQQRLPGLVYGFGVWRIRSTDSLGLGPAVRAALPFPSPGRDAGLLPRPRHGMERGGCRHGGGRPGLRPKDRLRRHAASLCPQPLAPQRRRPADALGANRDLPRSLRRGNRAAPSRAGRHLRLALGGAAPRLSHESESPGRSARQSLDQREPLHRSAARSTRAPRLRGPRPSSVSPASGSARRASTARPVPAAIGSVSATSSTRSRPGRAGPRRSSSSSSGRRRRPSVSNRTRARASPGPPTSRPPSAFPTE